MPRSSRRPSKPVDEPAEAELLTPVIEDENENLFDTIDIESPTVRQRAGAFVYSALRRLSRLTTEEEEDAEPLVGDGRYHTSRKPVLLAAVLCGLSCGLAFAAFLAVYQRAAPATAAPSLDDALDAVHKPTLDLQWPMINRRRGSRGFAKRFLAANTRNLTVACGSIHGHTCCAKAAPPSPSPSTAASASTAGANGRCESWCATNSKPWQPNKCQWMLACMGCPQCAAPQCDANKRPICTGERKSIDAIVLIATQNALPTSTPTAAFSSSSDDGGDEPQQQHTPPSLRRAVASLITNLKKTLASSDLLLWHEAERTSAFFAEATSLGIGLGTEYNARLCLLDCCSGWGAPPSLESIPYYLSNGRGPLQHWPPSALYTIRWLAFTMWRTLDTLGYKWVMRMDDTAAIHSRIGYNLFESMRESEMEFGYRMVKRLDSSDCSSLMELAKGSNELRRLPQWRDFCANQKVLQPVGYASTWFVSRVQWWLTPRVQALHRAYDRSHLTFTKRLTEDALQTAIILTLLPPEKRRHFLDFAYEHVTLTPSGQALEAGFATGYRHPGKQGQLASARAWRQGWLHNQLNESMLLGEGAPSMSHMPMPINCSGRETAAVDAPVRRNYLVGSFPYCEATADPEEGLLARQEIWKEREKKGEDQNEAALDDADDLDKPWPEA